jgi:hypothetical protein
MTKRQVRKTISIPAEFSDVRNYLREIEKSDGNISREICEAVRQYISEEKKIDKLSNKVDTVLNILKRKNVV